MRPRLSPPPAAAATSTAAQPGTRRAAQAPQAVIVTSQVIFMPLESNLSTVQDPALALHRYGLGRICIHKWSNAATTLFACKHFSCVQFLHLSAKHLQELEMLDLELSNNSGK